MATKSQELHTQLTELTEKRTVAETAQGQLLQKAQTEAEDGKEIRDFSEEEENQFNGYTSQMRAFDEKIETIKGRIETQKGIDEAVKRQAKVQAPTIIKDRDDSEVGLMKKFSITRAIDNYMDRGGMLEGAEAEVHKEGTKECQELKLSYSGIVIPSNFYRIGNPGKNTVERSKYAFQKRTTQTAGTAATAGNLIIDDPAIGVVGMFQPRLLTTQLGATVLSGLTGDVPLIKQDGQSAIAWEGEVDANAESNPTLAKTTLSPKRFGLFVPYSKQLSFQANWAADAFLMNDINNALARAADDVALEGGGTNEPTGIIATSGIGDVAGGANGLIPTWAHLIELETDVAAANADVDTMHYVTTPGIRGVLKAIDKGTDTGQFVYMGNEINGFSAWATTQAPSDLTKGTSSGVCHAIYFGNWSDLIIAKWGGVDIVIDPYSRKKETIIELAVNSWMDVALRNVASFSCMKDALIV